MANFGYTHAKTLFLSGSINLSSDDIRVGLAMTNTTINGAGQEDVTSFTGFTTLDEYDGANYVNKALATKTVTDDTTNNRGVFDADDVTSTALGAGTRQ